MVLEMIGKADVVVENFAHGAMERLGLGYEDLKKINPSIIYAYSLGYARKGPYGHKPAFDDLVQGVSGAASLQSRVDGLPPATVEPSDPALLERIRQEVLVKTEAFASRADTDDFRDGFVWPLETYRVSSAWGARRVLNGTPARPHYGVDLAAPIGTVIRVPADGRVVFTRPDMHFEGGLTLIDHGQGLISAYLHQSQIDVAAGQTVRRGDPMGRVGMSGRATGPHLCWRLKWRDRNLDPSLLIGARPPERLA
jgi:murein DD-endopeptidase MepM/ murein hydrolase activator NlpD